MHAMATTYLRGDISASRALQFHLLPLIRALFAQVSPIPIKTAMEWMGLCEGTLRLPLVPLEDGLREKLKRELLRMRLIDA